MKIGIPFRALAAVSIATAIAACGNARATNSARQDDLRRDLDLASATTMNLATTRVDPSLLDSLETRPQGAPLASTTIKKGAGSHAVRSRTPTVRATPVAEPAADDAAEATQSVAEAPAPDVSEPVAVAPRPAPVPAQPAGDYGTGGGGVIFGAGMGGVIIRGGGVDGDNCDLHTRGGRRGTSRGPIYMPTIPIATQPAGPAGPAGPATSGPRSRPSRRGF